MLYKKYDILPQYTPGSDFVVKDNGLTYTRKPKPQDVDFFTTVHRVTGEEMPNSLTREEAKQFIDKINEIEVRAL
jgi:hypothetical protein